ncbi:MAG: phosphotransferase family protein [Deltaproteobacteria bacterium]|nr:phosphotransferase family protein [Deltaproteobacteria bacterium]
MRDSTDSLPEALTTAAEKHFGGPVKLSGLQSLTGGSSSESWSFDAEFNQQHFQLVLRRTAGKTERAPIDKRTEAILQQLAAQKNVPVATIRFILDEEDGLGPGYVMDRIPGETIPRKILRDGEYAEARKNLSRQCGSILARIHSIEAGSLPPLDKTPVREQIHRLMTVPQIYKENVPTFEFAVRWMMDHRPPERSPGLVHGDFRNGNLVVGPEGIRAVLDWELAHLGDPMEDLGYISINSWRFGNIDQPVGGFGQREDLFSGYEEEGGLKVDKEAVHFWEVFSTFKWGIICIVQGHAHLSGSVRSVNRAATGRRVSETEVDLMNLLGY